MTHFVRPVAMAIVLLVGAVIAPALVATTPVTADSESDCTNAVVYDAFRFDNETVHAAMNESATATAKNTEVRVEQNAGFIRVNGSNPNGYCVEFHVRLHEDIVAPAELGEVTSNDGNHSAEWHAIRDFERETTYTEVVFTLPAGESAAFAPSKLRVETLSWTGAAKSTGGSWWEDLTGITWGDDDPLEKRTYTFTATNSTDRVTVSLTDDETNRTVEEWDAMYRTRNQSGWRPVSTDSTAPVFYRQIDDERVEFVFNDQTGEVKFTANPTSWDKAKSSWDSWWSGVDILDGTFDGLFGD